MARKKITDYDAAATLTGAELVEVVQSGANVKAIAQNLANLFIKAQSLTTAQRNALTAADGMVIYNTTDHKFQGRVNGAWVNFDTTAI